MSIYNGESYLHDSIECILNQTYRDFEFIIINDGSSDKTQEIINKYAEDDIRIVPINQDNIGLTKSLNKGILLSKGKYIARQDVDDISVPDRLENQIETFSKCPSLVLLGTWYSVEDSGGVIMERCRPIGDTDLRKLLYRCNPFCHSSVMFKRDAWEEVGGYRENMKTSQDFDLWLRIALTGKIALIPKILVRHFRNPKSISKGKQSWTQITYSFYYRLTNKKLISSHYAVISAVISLLYSLCVKCIPDKILYYYLSCKSGRKISNRSNII
jgi:glycosyltransferase involved in cell wall biosynthesis